MTRSLSRPGRPAAIVAAAAVVATGAHGAQATGSVTIESPVNVQVTQNLRMQTRIMLGNGNVASLSVNTIGGDGGDGGGQLPAALTPDGGGAVPPDTNISIDTSGAQSGNGLMLVLVQFN